MLRRIKTSFFRLYDKQIDARGLAAFRILYGLTLLAEIIHLFWFRHLVYDVVPYVQPSEIDVTVPFIVWMISVGLIVFGLFTRTATIVNYVCSLVFIATVNTYEYHMFYAYMGINLLIIFLPVSRQWSLDRLLLKFKYSNTRFQYKPPTTVSALAYLVPVFIGVGLVYADSILYKLNDPVWMKGLGMWLPASLSMITQSSVDWVINHEWLVRFLGYFTIFFEFVFIFIMWSKRFRWFCFVVGIGLHVGILIDFPIPYFAVGVIALYLLMLPVGVFKKLDKIKRKKPALYFYFDAECPLCVRTKITIQHLDGFGAVEFRSVQGHAANEPAFKDIDPEELYRDIYSVSPKGKVYHGVDTYIRVFNAIGFLKPLSWLLRVPGIYHLAKAVYRRVAGSRITERCTEDTCGYVPPVVPQQDAGIKLSQNMTLGDLKKGIVWVFFIFVIIVQLLVSYNSSLTDRTRTALHLKGRSIDKVLSDISEGTNTYGKLFMGVTHHPVFVNSHFEGYNHIIAVSYCAPDGTEKRLPLIDERGMPGSYIYGFNWVKWSFRVSGPNVKMPQLEDGLRAFTAFWAHRNGLKLQADSFKIYVKKIHVPKQWEKDYLRNQLADQHWIEAGKVYWNKRQFAASIHDIESL